MGKGIGLIGAFNGKIGSAVGFKISASSNRQKQGYRAYQGNISNPRTAGQAEQRAKIAPINDTYRLLKEIIDRGNEFQPYGNKSRIEWLKGAHKPDVMPWFEKDADVWAPVCCTLTKGSLEFNNYLHDGSQRCELPVGGITADTTNTIGLLSTHILANFPTIQEGDQLTFLVVYQRKHVMMSSIYSIIIDSTSTDAVPTVFTIEENILVFTPNTQNMRAGAIILSREGLNGKHLRSTTSLVPLAGYPNSVRLDEAKERAIKSYMNSGSGHSDWAEESIE